MKRNRRHQILQNVFWTGTGFAILRRWKSFTRKFESVVLNKSLHSETNGEAWLPTVLPKDPTVIDVGYFEGDYAQLVLEVRPDAKVYSFDPSKSALRHNQSHSDKRINFVHAALDKQTGTGVFYDYHNMCGSLTGRDDAGELKETYEVPVHTLDTWVDANNIPKIDLLKIDAEGFDVNVIEGASQLLLQQRIDIFQFEYADGWIANRRFLKDAFDFMSDKPYQLYRLFNGFVVPFSYSTIEERFDLGYMVVGISKTFAELGKVPTRVG